MANCEAPTDHAITASLFNEAKNKIKYILSGGNLSTESIMPKSWGHYNQDLKLLLNVHKDLVSKIKIFLQLVLSNIYITCLYWNQTNSNFKLY